MGKKIVDIMAFRIEKALKENGFTVKKDKDTNIMLLIKLNNSEIVDD